MVKSAVVFTMVRDMKAQVHFYRDILGLKMVPERSSDDWTQFDIEGTPFALHAGREDGNSEPNQAVILGLHVSDIDSFINNLKSDSVRVVEEIRDEPFGKLAGILDPEGNYISIFEPKYHG